MVFSCLNQLQVPFVQVHEIKGFPEHNICFAVHGYLYFIYVGKLDQGIDYGIYHYIGSDIINLGHEILIHIHIADSVLYRNTQNFGGGVDNRKGVFGIRPLHQVFHYQLFHEYCCYIPPA